jgi:hypothetical protein
MTDNGTYRRVDDLQPGDRFVWVDRPVSLQSVQITTARRAGRWLTVIEDNGNEHRLHYYDQERVLDA